jgi:hypothetical protein
MDELAPGQGKPAPKDTGKTTYTYKEDSVKTTSTYKDVTANNIDAALRARVDEIAKTATQPVARPPDPAQTPIYEPTSREMNVAPKPGGVVIQAKAEIDGLKPEDVVSVSSDVSAKVLKLALRSGAVVTYPIDPDNFTVALRCIFDRQVDPALTMEITENKPGYHAVNYSGPLFRTKFGKILYNADQLLGALIFARDGDHRTIAAEVVPHFAELTCEAHQTMTLGSRVYLRATRVRFGVQDGQLIGRGVQTKIDVEGLGYTAAYYQESFHRLARALDEHFDALTEQFIEFQEFGLLAEYVALAKWIKRHAIAMDWAALKGRTIAQEDFPAYSPTTEWYCLFNGHNLDGWQVNLPSGDVQWLSENGALMLRPTGPKALEILSENWLASYDIRYTVVTHGPVEFIIRSTPGASGASVTIDTKGRPQRVELFMVNGEWTALAPGLGQSGKLTKSAGDSRESNDFGLRVPPGSKLTIFAAAVRGRG